MLEKLEDLPPGIEGVKAVGIVTREDYARVLRPLVDAARRDRHRLRLLYEIGADFERVTAGAMLADTAVTLRSRGVVDACAIVTDERWMRIATSLLRGLMPYPIRLFAPRDRHLAIGWLSALSSETGISHHLLTDSGVLVVEVNGPLRARDFEALAITADTWIESHGLLTGIVVHSLGRPRWQDVEALRAHVRFVRERRHMVDRVAVASDSPLRRIVDLAGRRIGPPRMRAFAYDELRAAIDWAATANEAARRREPLPPRPKTGPRIVDAFDPHDDERDPGIKPAGWPPS